MATNRIRFIYVWTVEDSSVMEDYIRIGVNGMISDYPSVLAGILNKPEIRSLVRLAKRTDNPFVPYNFAYGLVVYTRPSFPNPVNTTITLNGTAVAFHLQKWLSA